MRTLLFLAIAISTITCAAQTVRILSVRGDVQVRVNNKDVPAKSGQAIERSTPITLGAGGLLSLISSNGQMAEVSGNAVTTPEKEFAKTESSTSTQRIAKYLWSNFVNKSTVGVEQGTVYRSNTIQVVWPPAMSLDTPTVELRWMPLASMDRKYVLSLHDDADSLLLSQELRDTFLVLNLHTHRSYVADRCVYWSVRHASMPNSASSPRCLQLLSTHERGILDGRIADVVSFASGADRTQSPLVMIMTAAVYEEFGLYDRALDYFMQAYEMTPSEDYLALARACRLRGLGE